MIVHIFAKADSVEFLDLCAPEFHETRNNTTLIYALDLRVAPQRYYYLPEWFDETRDETILHLRRRLDSGFYPPFQHFRNQAVYSSKKLIEVAGLDDGDFDALSFPFSDFLINGFESFSKNWESERMRLYLKFVKTYCHYVETSIIFTEPHSKNVILTFERPPTVYETSFSSRLIYHIKKRVLQKLILTLFENNSADSKFLGEIFLTMGTDQDKIDFLFVLEAKLTEYLLSHLKTEMYDFRRMSESLQGSSWFRSNPEHLVVFLNYGLKIKSPLPRGYTMFKQFHPYYQCQMYWENLISLGKQGRNLKPREKVILDIFDHFLTFSVPQFAIYLKSLRYIWRSIPDTFITYEEMMTLLFRNANITNVEDICSKLQKLEFESFDTILQPRSLTHYSRCVLRDSLERNSQLPKGIELLSLPNRLKSYLKLEF